MRILTAVPVFNEIRSVESVLREVRRHADEILVVDDGSTDGTSEFLQATEGLTVVRHPKNRGYGAAIISAFRYAIGHEYDALVTIDCDGQHQPALIPEIVRKLADSDIASGSRYLKTFRQDTSAYGDRREVNAVITSELNEAFGLGITDAFCGFKAYRVAALRFLNPSEQGWGMPLQVWVQAARQGLTVCEVAVPRVYLDAARSFGEDLDVTANRLRYYRGVIDAARLDPLPGQPALAVTEAAC